MKLPSLVRLAAAAAPIVVLSGCAAYQGGQPGGHDAHHPQSSRQAAMGAGMSNDMWMSDDVCAMHEEMMNASPEQRRAIMARHMKNMPPEVLKRHMDVMNMQMQMMREYMMTPR